MTAELFESLTEKDTEPSRQPPIVITRRKIDRVLIAAGAVVAVVLAVAGGLLTWGSSFANDYVKDELSAQNIFFPDADSLRGQGRDDLVGYAEQQVTTGDEAEAYASFINGHLQETADGQTYADLGAVQRQANQAVTDAVESGAPDDEVASLQATADEITRQRDTLFKGETLRGLLLSTFAWSTIGRIAFIASIVAYLAAGLMVALVAAGFVHLRRGHAH